ncbi:hypothetical protein A2U01_0003255, partial [Trifolium medium]|nr:hypothetical protein [Trifolium medium]
MLKKVLGKGKKSTPQQEEEPSKKKRNTRSSKSGEGGSSSQQQSPPQAPSYVQAFVVANPFLHPNEHPWSDTFYTEAKNKRYAQIKSFKFIQEKGFKDGLKEVPEIYNELRKRKWMKFNELMEKDKMKGNDKLVKEFYANAWQKKGSVPRYNVYVRGVMVDYSEDAINKFLGALVPPQCALIPAKEELENWPEERRREIRDFVGCPGTPWLKYSGATHPTKIRLGDFKSLVRAWAEFFHRNVAPVGNNSEYQIENALAVKLIMEEKDFNLGYWLQESIRKIAWHEANKFGLGHCNLITALFQKKKGPVIPPVMPNVGGIHVEEPVNMGAVHMEEDDELMEEIDRFDGGVQPDQQQHDNWPYTHSEHEIASLLHNLDINTALHLPNVYYNTQGALYTESMTYRQEFPPAPFFPYYPTWEAWQEFVRVDRINYDATMA